jgi:hypothetical protein
MGSVIIIIIIIIVINIIIIQRRPNSFLEDVRKVNRRYVKPLCLKKT